MTENVWDRFLTKRDKAGFAAGGFGARAEFGKRPALLVIDAVLDSSRHHTITAP